MTGHFMLVNQPFTCSVIVFTTGQTCIWDWRADLE